MSDYVEEFDYLISSGIALEVKAISKPSFPLIECGARITRTRIQPLLLRQQENRRGGLSHRRHGQSVCSSTGDKVWQRLSSV